VSDFFAGLALVFAIGVFAVGALMCAGMLLFLVYEAATSDGRPTKNMGAR
jgi:hypothetical protein